MEILLVDDDIVSSFLVKKIIHSRWPDIGIHTEGSGKKAIDFLMNHISALPDVIMVDLYMPEMNGFEFIEWIRNSELRKSGMLIVMATSSMEMKDRHRAWELGVSDYLIKPLTVENINSIISRVK
jgi:CheY-like chemotaxis protein